MLGSLEPGLRAAGSPLRRKPIGRPVEGVPGYSYRMEQIVLIDNPANTSRSSLVRTKSKRSFDNAELYGTPSRPFTDKRISLIPDSDLGDMEVPIGLATYSNRGIAFIKSR